MVQLMFFGVSKQLFLMREISKSVHCKCLQVFPAISMEKGCKNHKETLYSSKGKIVYVVGNPCNIYRLQGNPIVIIGFFLQSVNITGFPHNVHNISL